VASKQAQDLRRLGTVLLLGMVAGAGVRYYINSRARVAGRAPARLIDWAQARAVAQRIARGSSNPSTTATPAPGRTPSRCGAASP